MEGPPRVRRLPPLPKRPGAPLRPETERVPLDGGALQHAVELVAQQRVSAVADDETTEAAKKYEDLLRFDLAFFAGEILQGPPEEPYNGLFIIDRHQEDWSELIMNHGRLCLMAPRDHGKTQFCTIAYAIWQSWRLPRNEGLIFSGSIHLATEILGKIKAEIESNPKLRYLQPTDAKTRVWTKTKIRLSNGSVISVKSFGSSVRGAHPKWCVCDDVLTDEDAFSELIRSKNIDFFLNAVTNMIAPSPIPTIGQIIFVGTPFHPSDLFAYLEDNPEWAFQRFPAESEEGEPLWPLRFNRLRLDGKRREIGTIRYTREFLCRPVSGVSSLFPLELFEDGFRFLISLGSPREAFARKGVVSYYAGVDIAVSASVEADFFVIFVLGIDERGNRWICDIHRSRGLGYAQQKWEIQKITSKYSCELVFVEANAAQRIYGVDLAQNSDVPAVPVATGTEKHLLEKGIPGMRTLLENGKYRIPRGDERSIELTDLWITEMGGFTFDGEVKSVGRHDDVAMASWIAEKALRGGLFSFSSNETDADEEAYQQIYGYLKELESQELDPISDVPSLSRAGGRLGDINQENVGIY